MEKMDKKIILQKYKSEDEKLIISKLFDKIEALEKTNKIQITDFLTPVEGELLNKVLKHIEFSQYKIYGGVDSSERNIIILFPSKIEEIIMQNKFDYNSICSCVRINDIDSNIEHKDILGGLMKLGIKREKIGDIMVYENYVDIIVCKEITKFLLANLNQLKRFKDADIQIVDIAECKGKKQKFEDINIIVSSLRLDNIVAELAKTSRSKASEILNQERVFINYENEIKNTKMVKKDDVVTIRGKGKFIIDEIVGNTRSGRFIVKVKKYV